MMRRILGILPGVLAVAFATAQKPVEIIQVDQCEVIEIGVQEFPGDRYEWDLYSDPNVNFATEAGEVALDGHFEQGQKTGSVIRIHDLPAGRYFLRLMAWDEDNYDCTNNLIVFILDVEEVPPIYEANEYCYGDYNEVRITLTGSGPWEITYTIDNETNQQVVQLIGDVEPIYHLPIPVLAPGKHSLWVMEIRGACAVYSYEVPKEVELIIHARPRTSRIYVKPEEEEQNP